MAWKITFATSGDYYFFITHVRNCVMGATPMSIVLTVRIATTLTGRNV